VEVERERVENRRGRVEKERREKKWVREEVEEQIEKSYQLEMTYLQRNNSFYTSNISSCTTKSDKMNAINEKPLLSRKNTSYSSGRKPESPSCTSSLHLSAKQGHNLSLVSAPKERHFEPSENDDSTKSSVHIPGEDLCWSTPDPMSRVKFNGKTFI
jgi:hypothetical protein